MLKDIFNGPRHDHTPDGEYERPTEFHKETAELTHDPIPDYASDPETGAPAGYFAEHGETEHLVATPVFLTEPPPETQNWTDWTCGTVPLGIQAIQYGDATRKRTRFVVRNLDAANLVYVSRLRSDLTAMAAYQIPPGKREEFFHNGPICLSTNVAGTLATFYSEIDVPDPA
jgi:hypothetical protein